MLRGIYSTSVPQCHGFCVLCPEPTFDVIGALLLLTMMTPSCLKSFRALLSLGSTEGEICSLVATTVAWIDLGFDPVPSTIVGGPTHTPSTPSFRDRTNPEFFKCLSNVFSESGLVK